MRKPKLNWLTPQQAVKRSANGMIGVFASWGVVGVFIIIIAILGWEALNNALVLGVFFAVAAVLAVLSYLLLMKTTDKRFPEITG